MVNFKTLLPIDRRTIRELEITTDSRAPHVRLFTAPCPRYIYSSLEPPHIQNQQPQFINDYFIQPISWFGMHIIRFNDSSFFVSIDYLAHTYLIGQKNWQPATVIWNLSSTHASTKS